MTDARMRSAYSANGAKTGRLPPKEICLSRAEMHELTTLTIYEQSAMPFWKAAFAKRSISCPQGRVCCMIFMAPDLFQLEWHRKALGPKAIAAGRDYRAFAERKDREFAARASR